MQHVYRMTHGYSYPKKVTKITLQEDLKKDRRRISEAFKCLKDKQLITVIDDHITINFDKINEKLSTGKAPEIRQSAGNPAESAGNPAESRRKSGALYYKEEEEEEERKKAPSFPLFFVSLVDNFSQADQIHTGKSLDKAQKVFESMNVDEEEFSKMLAWIEREKSVYATNRKSGYEGKFWPTLETWLKNKTWMLENSEIIKKAQGYNNVRIPDPPKPCEAPGCTGTGYEHIMCDNRVVCNEHFDKIRYDGYRLPSNGTENKKFNGVDSINYSHPIHTHRVGSENDSKSLKLILQELGVRQNE